MIEASNVTCSETILPIDKYSSIREVYRITNKVAKAFRRWYENCKAFSDKPREWVHFSAERHYILAAQCSNYPLVYECLLRKPTQEQFSSARKFIKDLSLVLDDEGLIRSLGRLENAENSQIANSPILLPPKSHLCNLIVRQAHERCLHGGTGETLTHLRRRFWVPKGRQTVKSITSRCVTCKH